MVFERFTDEARRTVVLAQEEARLLGHNYIGTEHFLLALTREEHTKAADALRSVGAQHEAVQGLVREIIGEGDERPTGHIPFTPRSKKVLELGFREAMQLGHKEIRPEHILLGLLHEPECVAMRIMAHLGADTERTRRAVLDDPPQTRT